MDSIEGHLLGIKRSATIDQVARELADRIVGIEQEELLSEAGSEAGREASAPVLMPAT